MPVPWVVLTGFAHGQETVCPLDHGQIPLTQNCPNKLRGAFKNCTEQQNNNDEEEEEEDDDETFSFSFLRYLFLVFLFFLCILLFLCFLLLFFFFSSARLKTFVRFFVASISLSLICCCWTLFCLSYSGFAFCISIRSALSYSTHVK